MAVLLLGCGGSETGGDAAVEVRDSAGVRVVENRAPLWSEGSGWTIDADPVLQIGVVEGEEPYQLASVGSATRRSDGVLAVTEARAGEIRLFDPQGAHLRTIGRRGEGPGEFATGPLVAWVPPDSLLAWDPGLRRMTWFDDEGNVARQTVLRQELADAGVPGMRDILGALDLSADATLLARGGGLEVERLRLVTADGSATSLGDYPAQERISAGGWLVSHAFSPYPFPALGAGPFAAFVARRGEREVTGFDAGGNVAALLRIHVHRAPVSSSMLEAEREKWRERAGEEGVAAFGRLTIPDSLPAIQRLHVDAAGNVWVGRRGRGDQATATEFDVLDPDGRWLGTVQLPEPIQRIWEVGDDYVLGLWRDDLDVSYVRMYRLVK